MSAQLYDFTFPIDDPITVPDSIQNECDLFTFSLETSDSGTVLERRGDYQLGEVVTRFLPGT